MLSVTDIQARHAPAVLAGEVRLAARWGQPDLGYVLLFRPDAAASSALAAVQDQVEALEPSLLRQPLAQLHASIAWLLPVARDFSEPKQEIWSRHAEDWLKVVSALTDATPPMALRYQRVVATDAAIVAVANEPGPMAGFRRSLIDALGLEWPIAYPELGVVHSSLFRYAEPPASPGVLLQRLESMPVCVPVVVSEMLMVREYTYPTLAYEILRRLPLRG